MDARNELSERVIKAATVRVLEQQPRWAQSPFPKIEDSDSGEITFVCFQALEFEVEAALKKMGWEVEKRFVPRVEHRYRLKMVHANQSMYMWLSSAMLSSAATGGTLTVLSLLFNHFVSGYQCYS